MKAQALPRASLAAMHKDRHDLHRGELLFAFEAFFLLISSPKSLTELSLLDPGLAPGEVGAFVEIAK